MEKCKVTIAMDGAIMSRDVDLDSVLARRVIEAAEDFLQDSKSRPVGGDIAWDPRYVSDEIYEESPAPEPAPSVYLERCRQCSARTLVCRGPMGYRRRS